MFPDLSWCDWLIVYLLSSVFWFPLLLGELFFYRQRCRARRDYQKMEERLKEQGLWPGIWLIKPGQSFAIYRTEKGHHVEITDIETPHGP